MVATMPPESMASLALWSSLPDGLLEPADASPPMPASRPKSLSMPSMPSTSRNPCDGGGRAWGSKPGDRPPRNGIGAPPPPPATWRCMWRGSRSTASGTPAGTAAVGMRSHSPTRASAHTSMPGRRVASVGAAAEGAACNERGRSTVNATISGGSSDWGGAAAGTPGGSATGRPGRTAGSTAATLLPCASVYAVTPRAPSAATTPRAAGGRGTRALLPGSSTALRGSHCSTAAPAACACAAAAASAAGHGAGGTGASASDGGGAHTVHRPVGVEYTAVSPRSPTTTADGASKRASAGAHARTANGGRAGCPAPPLVAAGAGEDASPAAALVARRRRRGGRRTARACKTGGSATKGVAVVSTPSPTTPGGRPPVEKVRVDEPTPRPAT